jgi:hypothetical protein
MSNTIRWFESAALDAPELKSPQPCPRGIHCNYMINISDQWEPGCCRGVHPGEEGNGRRLFPARTLDDGREQPACVRLTGMADFYERRRLRLSWGQWCERQGIPFTPAVPGQPFPPLVRSPLGGKHYNQSPYEMPIGTRADGSTVWGLNPRAVEPAGKLSKNQRKRRNKKAAQAVGAAETLIVDTVEQSTMTCEQVEAELRAGAHSPKPVYPPQSLNLSWTPPRGGMPSNGFRCGECSPDCSCPYGWMCGDRSESREQDHDIASMVAAAAAASAAASSP